MRMDELEDLVFGPVSECDTTCGSGRDAQCPSPEALHEWGSHHPHWPAAMPPGIRPSGRVIPIHPPTTPDHRVRNVVPAGQNCTQTQPKMAVVLTVWGHGSTFDAGNSCGSGGVVPDQEHAIQPRRSTLGLV